MRLRSDADQEMPGQEPPGQRAFISHGWKDKALARRIGRRLGVCIWIDEAEMQVGDRLSQRLADEIRASSHLLVVLTAAAVASRWVAQEIDVARQAGIAIVPLLAEAGLSAPLLDEVMAIDITDPLSFETRMDVLAGALLGAPVSTERDRGAIRRDLAAIGRETPELRGLIDQLADRGRLTHAQLDAVSLAEPLRHPAETALIALHECADDQARYVISLVAAKLYRELGSATRSWGGRSSWSPPARCTCTRCSLTWATRSEGSRIWTGPFGCSSRHRPRRVRRLRPSFAPTSISSATSIATRR
jgi:TIR domain